MTSWTSESLQQAKQLAPWRSNLPWWVVLVEGIVLSVIGILILINPQQTAVNVALFLTIILIISGILQLWSALRDRVMPGAESIVTARGAIALFAGISIWLLLYMNALTPDVGRVLFGLGALTYGLLGLGLIFNTSGAQRRTAIIESIFYIVIGLLMVYVLFVGPEAVHTATRIMGWLALICGLALIGMAIWRWREGKEAEEKIDSATVALQEKAQDNPDVVEAIGDSKDDAVSADEAGDAVQEQADDAVDQAQDASEAATDNKS